MLIPMIKVLNFRKVIMWEYQNTKAFLLKDILQAGLKKSFWLVKLTKLSHGHMLLMILMVSKLLGHFMEKNCKKQIKKNLE